MFYKNLFQRLAIVLILATASSGKAQTWLPYNYWTFDGTNGLKDSMNHNDLDPNTYLSAYQLKSGGSNGVGQCYSMNVATSNKIVGATALPIDSGFTMEFLFRPGSNINETLQLFLRGDAAVSIRFSYASIKFSTKIIPTGTTTGVVNSWEKQLDGVGRNSYGYFVDGNWHHLAFRYNTKTGIKEIWIDGQLPEGFTDTVPETGLFAANASSPSSNTCYLNSSFDYYRYSGDLDEIAVYTYALPANMIYKHYNDFQQNHHYSFANSTVAPPAPDPAIGSIDPNEFAPGFPNSNVDAIVQLKSFPIPRYKPGNTLNLNLDCFEPHYVGGGGQPGVVDPVGRSCEVQREVVTNFNYMFMVTGNTHNVSAFGDTDRYDGAWIKMANDNPNWKISASAFWAQLSPTSIGMSSLSPYAKCQVLPDNSYLRDSTGHFLDQAGKLASVKYLSPETPLDSIRYDGVTQHYYLSQLFSHLNRPLDVLYENGEVIWHWNPVGLANDPVVKAAMTASGLDGSNYVGNRFKRIVDSYKSEFINMPQLANTRFMHFEISGIPLGAWNYGQTRKINSPINGKYYSSNDIYIGSPRNWRNGAGNFNGWQDVIDMRTEELKYGDSLYSPVVSPGYTYDETRYTRPGQWLGFLKAVALTGAEHFMTGYFVTSQPYQIPENYVWQLVYPPYVQAITSRYEDLLRNGHLMDGDVPLSSNNLTQPGFSFKAGDVRKLVVGRKHNTLNKYVLSGTIQPNNVQEGNAELTGNATINLDGQTLKFNISRQGSTYIYDNTNPTAPVFYQLDAWHEYKHPYYWSKTFAFEAELYDNNAPVDIKTKVPSGTTAGDYTNYTTYVSFKTAGSLEYNFQPRGTTATHYLWVLARSKDGTAQSLNVNLDGAISKNIGCIQDTNWIWYRYDASTGTPISFANLTLQNHKLLVTCNTSKVEIDKIIISPSSGNLYTGNVAGICNQGVSGLATITANGNTTFCQGDSVTLIANTGTAYLWSTGATTKSIKVTTAGSYIVTVTNGTSAVSLPQVVVVNSLPVNTVTANGPTTFCSGGSVMLTAAASGTYLWTPGGANTQTITATTAGNYSVVVTGTGNCSSVSAVTTVVTSGSGSPASITTSGSTTVCQGSAVSLTANLGVTYLWSNGATTRAISATASGNYLVTVTYSSGCNATSSATAVTINPYPTNAVTASGSTTICNGGSVALTANSITGTYLWTPGGATTRTITATAAGNYSVTVTGTGGCSITSPATMVTVNGSGTPASITPSGATSFCQGGSVNLVANSGNSYLWSNGATTNSITAASTGNYSVTVTYATGCNATSTATSVTVNPIPASGVTASGTTTFCNGGSVTLTANSITGTYLWTPGGATTRAITVSTSGNYSVVAMGTGGCSATSPVTTVSANGSGTPASITPAGATTFCQGGSVNLVANSGSSYLWSNGATTNNITATTSGSYSVTVTYSSGCSASSSSTSVTVNPLPASGVTASGVTTFCTGGSVTLTANSTTGTYLWTPGGATTRSISATTTGNYSVVVTGTGNCSVTSPITSVTVNTLGTPATISTSGATTFCQGGSVNLTANSGGNYLWSTGATTSSISTSTGGSYLVTVTYSSGCSSTSSAMNVIVNPIPSSGVTVSGATTFCAGGAVTLTSNSTTSTYLWTPGGATTRSINVTNAGSYSVVVTSNGNCSATSSATTVTVNTSTPATITPSGSTSFCQGGSVNLTANSGSSYLWSSGATTRTIPANATGSYSVVVNYSSGCSSASTPIAVTANPIPSNTVTPSGVTTFCNGGSVTLTSNSLTGTYLWSPGGATTRSISVSNSGSYSVVTTSLNCSSTSLPTLVTVTSGTITTPVVSNGLGRTYVCDGGTLILTSTTANSYLWSTGATTRTITISAAGNYSVTASNGTGCTATSAAMQITTVPQPNFTVTRSGPISFCNGGSVTFMVSQTVGQSYVWYKDNAQIVGANSSDYTVTEEGYFRVRVQKDGCAKSSGTAHVTIPCREGEELPGSEINDLQLSAYPNPFSTQTIISFYLPADDQVSVKVFDMQGRLVDILADKAQLSSGAIEINYDAVNLRKGLYFATLVTGTHGTKTIKISSLK